ncbi:hypothetical protein AYO38_11860 [bacterium SCGC AG-212-C10]|nr:hypothetical protein AYO38_11860 [bacterium SCGC AG-212-C10]
MRPLGVFLGTLLFVSFSLWAVSEFVFGIPLPAMVYVVPAWFISRPLLDSRLGRRLLGPGAQEDKPIPSPAAEGEDPDSH